MHNTSRLSQVSTWQRLLVAHRLCACGLHSLTRDGKDTFPGNFWQLLPCSCGLSPKLSMSPEEALPELLTHLAQRSHSHLVSTEA